MDIEGYEVSDNFIEGLKEESRIMNNKSYSEMNKTELFKEIKLIISLTNLCEADKNLFENLILEYSMR